MIFSNAASKRIFTDFTKIMKRSKSCMTCKYYKLLSKDCTKFGKYIQARKK